MSAETMTLDQLRVRGIDALNRELGTVGMIRFLQQFEKGSGDYSKERHEIIDDMDVDNIISEIHDKRKE